MSKKVAIISGASSGMGKEFALYVDKNFKNIDEIWLIARRRDRLEELRFEINRPCVIICEDLNDYKFNDYFRKMLSQEKPEIKILVNSAGYGIYGPATDSALETEIGMIDTNCRGLTSMCLMCIPYMIKNSRIINLASASAYIPQPGFSIYAATKSFVLSFSRSLNVELKSKDIFVTAVCPGPVSTEFFSIAENGNIKKPWYKEIFMADSKEVVKKAMEDAINKKEVSTYGISMKILAVFSKIIPHKFILKFYNK